MNEENLLVVENLTVEYEAGGNRFAAVAGIENRANDTAPEVNIVGHDVSQTVSIVVPIVAIDQDGIEGLQFT